MLLLYGSAAIGATVHIHYCMNKLTGISFVERKNAVCSNCGMPKTKAHGCCREECKQIKLYADQLTSPVYEAANVLSHAVVTPFIINTIVLPKVSAVVENTSHAPPGLQKQKLYLKNNVWLI